MKRIPYDSLDENQLRAYTYMDRITAPLAQGARAALLKGFALQDVAAAALCMAQTEMRPDDIAGAPVPGVLREALLAHAAGLGYVPSPIDTSHVVMTPQMEAVVDATAAAIHEDWRAARGKEGRPWSELSPEDRASTLNTATEAVKAIAALGGVSAADLDFKDTRDELSASLDEHIHEVWSANKVAGGARYGVERTKDPQGRDITHPDLVPYAELSEGSKSYDHAINGIILDAIHRENLTIDPQLSPAVKATEETMEGIRREAKVDTEAERIVDAVEREFKDAELAANMKIMNDGPLGGVAFDVAAAHLADDASKEGPVLPPKGHLLGDAPADRRLAARKMMAEVVSGKKMAPFSRDVLLEKNGDPVGIIRAGTMPAAGNRDFVNVDMIRLSSQDTDVDNAVSEAVWDEARRQGVPVTRFAKLNEARPLSPTNISDQELARKYMTSAVNEVKALMDKGFKVVDWKSGYSLSAADDTVAKAMKRAFPESAVAIEAMQQRGISVEYEGTNQEIRQALYDVDVRVLRAKAKVVNTEGDIIIVGNHMVSLMPERSSRADAFSPQQRMLDVEKALALFTERMKEPFSRETAIVDAFGEDAVRSGLRASAWMHVTGSSFNDAMAYVRAAEVSASAQKARLPHYDARGGLSEVEAYRAAVKDYESRGVIARLFRARPKLPQEPLDKYVDLARREAQRVETMVAIEAAMPKTPDKYDFVAGPAARAEILAARVQEYANMLGRTDEASQMQALRTSLTPDAVSAKLYPAEQRQEVPSEQVPEQALDYGINELRDYGLDAAKLAEIRENSMKGLPTPVDGTLPRRRMEAYDDASKVESCNVYAEVMVTRDGVKVYNPATHQEAGRWKDFMRSSKTDLKKTDKKPQEKTQKQNQEQNAAPQKKR